jgi:hypothetical protein
MENVSISSRRIHRDAELGCVLGRFIRKARTDGLTPEESQQHERSHKQHERHKLATAPDGPTDRVSQTPDERQLLAVLAPSPGQHRSYVQAACWR